MLDTEVRWANHWRKCHACRDHVSIDGLVIREDRLCEDGRQLFREFCAGLEAFLEVQAQTSRDLYDHAKECPACKDGRRWGNPCGVALQMQRTVDCASHDVRLAMEGRGSRQPV
jgi:hypothetical protein